MFMPLSSESLSDSYALATFATLATFKKSGVKKSKKVPLFLKVANNKWNHQYSLN